MDLKTLYKIRTIKGKKNTLQPATAPSQLPPVETQPKDTPTATPQVAKISAPTRSNKATLNAVKGILRKAKVTSTSTVVQEQSQSSLHQKSHSGKA